MIPKIIHYCWFGNKPMPERELRCMESWSKYLPEFKIMRWDEESFDINSSTFVRQAYDMKKWAFVADLVRLWALKNYGGIYLDTDIEILRPFDELLHYKAFGGFETDNVVQTGVIGSEANGEFINIIFNHYINASFVNQDGSLNTKPNSAIFAEILQKHGISTENIRSSNDLIELFPSEYFCPIEQATWEIKPTDNTYCIHYLSGSWLPYSDRLKRHIKTIVGKLFGFDFVEKLRNLILKK